MKVFKLDGEALAVSQRMMEHNERINREAQAIQERNEKLAMDLWKEMGAALGMRLGTDEPMPVSAHIDRSYIDLGYVFLRVDDSHISPEELFVNGVNPNRKTTVKH